MMGLIKTLIFCFNPTGEFPARWRVPYHLGCFGEFQAVMLDGNKVEDRMAYP